MSEEFISEPIEPVAGAFDTTAMTRGEPGLPERFKWRDKEYAVADVLEAWKELGPCRSGGNEKYLRKHCTASCFRVISMPFIILVVTLNLTGGNPR